MLSVQKSNKREREKKKNTFNLQYLCFSIIMEILKLKLVQIMCENHKISSFYKTRRWTFANIGAVRFAQKGEKEQPKTT